MNIADRILTIVITATLTSAAWIVFGSTLMEIAGDRQTGETGDAAATPPGGAEVPQGPPSVAVSENTVADDPALVAVPDPETGITIPVKGVAARSLTNSFTDARGANGARVHEAIDIMAPTGTAVVAAGPGTIAKLHRSGPGGNSIYVRSHDRLEIHYYAHLGQYAAGLSEGQTVRAGQTLGTVGSSGNADPSAPHLHFAIMETTSDSEWWEPSNPVNPYTLLIASGR